MTLTPTTSRDGSGAALTWTTFTAGGWYLNGAADFGGAYGSPSAAIDPAGDRVWLCGLVNPGTDGVFAQLPAAYRPSAQRLVLAYMGGTNSGIDVLTNGTLDAFSDPAVVISLDGLWYAL